MHVNLSPYDFIKAFLSIGIVITFSVRRIIKEDNLYPLHIHCSTESCREANAFQFLEEELNVP